MYSSINKITQKTIIKVFDGFSLGITLTLLFIVAFNILARAIHNQTNGSLNLMIPGAIELSRYALLLIVFSALPHASITGMVRVDLLSKQLPKAIATFLDRFWLILMATFTSILFWLFSQKALLIFNRGDASQDLQIPLFYFYSFISVASLATTFSCLIKAFNKTSEPLV